jgi:hypothetical protein
LLVDYADEGTPSAGEREQVESALSSLERAFEYGNDGLLLTVGYSPSYFDRYDEELPDSVDLPEPEGLMPTDDPDLDTQDAIIHLASDHAEAVLAAEEALLGEKAEVNGVEMESDVGDVFETVDRRTGFIGDGMPAERQDVDGIPEGEPVPEDSPLYMGFKSGFKKNRASEDSVTIEEGPFAGGTTEHVSKILLHLDEWYGDENDREDRWGRCSARSTPRRRKSRERGTISATPAVWTSARKTLSRPPRRRRSSVTPRRCSASARTTNRSSSAGTSTRPTTTSPAPTSPRCSRPSPTSSIRARR